MKRPAHVFIVLFACLATLGCMTTQPLPADRTQLSQTLKPNDRVEIVTKGGENLKFKLEKIDENGLHGAGETVAYDDIQTIGLEKISAGRTTLIALGVAAVAAVAAGGGGGGSSGY